MERLGGLLDTPSIVPAHVVALVSVVVDTHRPQFAAINGQQSVTSDRRVKKRTPITVSESNQSR
jgi:hypothetical protein